MWTKQFDNMAPISGKPELLQRIVSGEMNWANGGPVYFVRLWIGVGARFAVLLTYQSDLH